MNPTLFPHDPERATAIRTQNDQAEVALDMTGAPKLAAQRRRYERTECQDHAVAEVSIGRWPRVRRYQTKVLNVSNNGICVQIGSHEGDIRNSPARIRWVIPPESGYAQRPVACTMQGTVIHNGVADYCGIRFKGLVEEKVSTKSVRLERIMVSLAAGCVAALIVFLKSRNVVSFWYGPFFQVYSLAAAAFVLSRVGLAALYREPKDQGVLLSATLIIAAKNEEEHITETIDRCFQSRYPANLLEVIAVDDGSTDGTWDVLCSLQTKYPQLRCFKFEKNLGKRHAMALGAEKAKGDILIYIDSDSWLDPEGIYRIVQPFADPKVGAVAGHCSVIVEEDNFISKMEVVRYFVSQRIMKAAESVFKTVTCCPGPFSAYRRSAVMPILKAWLNQTFLGTQATFGDDRSLTNFILRRYRVLYHSGARTSTYVPNKWSVFIRQQLRWKKSWARETTVAVRFMFKKSPIAAISYYVSVGVTLLSPFIAFRAMIWLPFIGESISYLTYLIGLLLVYTFFGLVYQYHTQSSKWYYGFAFALMYVFIFSFQNYYAILTVRRNHWGTR